MNATESNARIVGRDILFSLSRHHPFDDLEAVHLARTSALVTAFPGEFWSRRNIAGHVTASVFVVDSQRKNALLLHHAALGKWLQPGGHMEEEDVSLEAAALRELSEECGIHPTSIQLHEHLFDVDVHTIPERTRDGVVEPAHHHHDLRILAILNPAPADGQTVTLSAESHGFEWVPLQELAKRDPSSGIGRMARKITSGAV